MRRGWELSQKNLVRQEDILRQTDNLQKLWQQLQDEVADRKSRLQAAALIKQVSRALSAGVSGMGDTDVAQFCHHMQGNSGRTTSSVVFKKISGSKVSTLLQASQAEDLSSWELL